MKRRISKCTGEVLCVRRRGRVQQNWMSARGGLGRAVSRGDRG